MTRSDDGFQVADVDTGLFDDAKVRGLARQLRDPVQIATHVALYEALVLGSWRAGHRIAFEDSLPAWWLEDASPILANLIAVGLVDDDGMVPERAWEAWFLPAYERRELRRAKGRKGGLAKAQAVAQAERDATPALAQVEQDHARALPVRPSVRPSDRPAEQGRHEVRGARANGLVEPMPQ